MLLKGSLNKQNYKYENGLDRKIIMGMTQLLKQFQTCRKLSREILPDNIQFIWNQYL